MTIEEQLKRKLEIRNKVRENMGESEPVKSEKFSNQNIDISGAEIHNELRHLENHIRYIQIHAIQSEYWELKSNRKIFGSFAIFYKKVFRKIINLTMGWYIRKILYQQTQYNQGNFWALKNVDHILEKQELQIEKINKKIEKVEEIDLLKKQIVKQEETMRKMEERFREELRVQREEYTIMIRYFDK